MRSVGALAILLASAPLAAQDLGRAVAAAEALGARTGVVVLAPDGTVQHRRRAREAFVPASNLKLLTAAAVLQRLGPDYKFTTRAELRAGRLVLHAGGDPNWIVGTEHAPETLFRALVASLQRLGVTAVRGVDLDRGAFTGPDRPPTWPQDQLWTAYCAPTGPFVLHQGTFALRVEPRSGDAGVALTAPLVTLPIDGRIATVGTRNGAVYGAIDHGDRLRVQGKIWRGSPAVEIRTAVQDPVAWFELALRQALRAGGIAIHDGAPEVTAALPAHRTPLLPAIARILGDSSNFDAEQCLRVLGNEKAGDGSLQGGLAVARQQLREWLPDDDGLVMVDGSGLSRENRVTPELLATAIRAMVRGPLAEPFVAALPVAGRSGTLEDRFVKSPVAGRVFAKTGWIRGASALSGILRRRDGGLVAFAILMNYDAKKGGLNKELKQLQERIVEAIDGGDS